MQMIQGTNNYLRRLAQTLALGLVVLGVAFLVACGDNQDTQATEVPQPTATSAAASTIALPTATPAAVSTMAQPTQEAPRATAVPTSTAAAAPTTAPAATPTTATTAPSRPPLKVVVTSNIVADWAEVIGGDRVEVFSLHSPGGDPHNIVPGARDVAQVAQADIVLSVGLGLETEWLEDLVHNASADPSRVVALGDGVDPLEFSEDAHHDEHMDEGDEEHDEMPIGRLLIGDGERGTISLIDLELGAVGQDHFDVGSRAGRIYSTGSGRYAIAVSSDANTSPPVRRRGLHGAARRPLRPRQRALRARWAWT